MKRRAYSCEAIAPRLKKTECGGDSSGSVRIRTLTAGPRLRSSGLPSRGITV
jgi:hypothetical protein